MKMHLKMQLTALVLTLCCGTALAQQQIVKPPDEPDNLGAIKQRLIEYQSCTGPACYGPQMERQIDAASAFLKQSVAAARPEEKLALVLDIDETSLSNWAVELHDDFGYIHADSDMCVAVWCGRAIPGTLRLYKEALAARVAVFFITGRPETQRADTGANLKAEGYTQWQHLYLRPVDHPRSETTAAYKSGDRADIVKQGYRIVLNVGDQMSDLEGSPMAEHSVKLPNPFYLIP